MSPIVFDAFKKIYRTEIDLANKLLPYHLENDKIVADENPTKDSLYGYKGLFVNIENIVKKDNKTSNEFWELYYQSKNIFISCLPVIPLGFRNYKDEIQFDMINNTYLSLIQSSNYLAKLEIDMHNRSYNLAFNKTQKIIQNIYDEIKLKLSAKSGLIRGNILGKRVDFSARSVITVDSDLKPEELGVPKRILVKIFEPWYIRHLTKEYNYSINNAVELLQKVFKDIEIDKKDKDNIDKVTDIIIHEKLIMAKRDPSLHRLSWQSFHIVPVEDKSIHVSPLITTGFNADFDGDTFSIFTPMSDESLEDTKKLLNPYSPANPQNIKYSFEKEFKYGLCLLLSKDYGPFKKEKTFLGIKINEGRIEIFDCLPKELQTKEYLEIINNNKNINDILTEFIEKIDYEHVKTFLYNLEQLLRKILTIFNSNLTIKDFISNPNIIKLSNEYKEEKDLEKKTILLQKLQDAIIEDLKNSESMEFIIRCKIVKFNQLLQLLGLKGIVLSPSGDTISIDENFVNGLNKEQYFNAGQGARMGIVSRTNKTAVTGYLARKLVYGLASVKLNPNIKDCGTTKFITLNNSEDILNRLINRYIRKDNDLILLTPENKHIFKNDKLLEIRSPLYCINPDICPTCYGEDYKLFDSTQIGFIAAQSVGERLTQELLKVFHAGGVIQLKTPDILKEESENTLISIEKLNQIFEYHDNILYARKEITFVLDKDHYNLNGPNLDEGLMIDMLIGDIIDQDKTLSLAINSNVILYVYNQESDSEKYYIKYQPNDKICTSLPESSDIEIKIKKILSIVEGRTIHRDVTHALNNMYKNLKGFGLVKLVHLEILLSQLLRCKHDLSKPSRLCSDDEIEIVSIKKIPMLESWVRGLEFENFNKSVINGLIHPERIKHSVLDDLMISENEDAKL